MAAILGLLMRFALILVFIAMPLLELAILIRVGQAIGFWPTFAIVVGTAVIGTTLLRRQGFQVLGKLSHDLSQGRPPLDSLADGALLLIAGAFLLTPGLITDTLGFLLLMPPVRALVRHAIGRKMAQSPHIFVDILNGRAGEQPHGARPQPEPRPGGPRDRPPREDGPIIDGEFQRLDETTRPPRR